MRDIVLRDLLSTDLDIISGGSDFLDNAAAQAVYMRASGGDFAVLGAFLGDELVGKGGVDFVAVPDVARIWMLSVVPAHRSHGIGTLLITELERLASDRQFATVELLVDVYNDRAKSLYERLGYVNAGELTEVVTDTEEDGTMFSHKTVSFRMQKRLKA